MTDMKLLESRKITNTLLAVIALLMAFSYFYPSYVRSVCVNQSTKPESRTDIKSEFHLGMIEFAYDLCVHSYGVSR